MSPEEIAAYESRRAALRGQYAASQAQNTYNQGLARIGYTTGSRDLTRQFDQMRQRLPGGYAKRGLLNSGIYKQGLENYGVERANSFGDLQQRLQSALGQFTIDQQSSSANYGTGLAQIATEEAARRAALAAQLKAVM